MFRSVASLFNINFRSRITLPLRHNSLVLTMQPMTFHESNSKQFSVKAPSTDFIVEDNFVKKFFKSVGWADRTRTRLKLSGYFLYENITEDIKFTDWFEVCELSDTFSSWFAITELHVWMMMVRLMAADVALPTNKEKYIREGDGRYVRNCMVEALWADVGNRVKVLEEVNQSLAKKQIVELSEQFQAVLVGYDEGIHNDRILAAAVWRRLFNMELVDVTHVERVVKLVRKQMNELDRIPWSTIINQPNIKWISIKDV